MRISIQGASRLLAVIGWVAIAGTAQGQPVFPPGTFRIAGVPVQCGPVVVVLDPTLSDAGRADGVGRIFLNPIAMQQMPPVLQFYLFAHECGHYVVGPDEVAADCWAVRTGRKQGWFPPAAFSALIQLFQNNPGDMSHPSGPNRVQLMMQCYSQ